jgi:hypothetical protein
LQLKIFLIHCTSYPPQKASCILRNRFTGNSDKSIQVNLASITDTSYFIIRANSQPDNFAE